MFRQEVTMEDLETKKMLEAMEADQSKKGSKFWAPQEGENEVRFLPPIKSKGEALPYFRHSVHWVDGQPFECLNQRIMDSSGNMHEAETCPICKKVRQLYKVAERGTEEFELAGQLNAKDRYVYRMVDRKSNTPTVPVFYESGPSIFKKFFAVMKSGKYGNIVHPTEGRDFIIDVQGTGRRANYDNSMPAPDKGPIFPTSEELKEVLVNTTKMDYHSLIEFRPAEELKEAMDAFLNPDGVEEETHVSHKAPAREERFSAREEKPAPSKAKETVAASSDEENDAIDDVLKEFDL